MDHEVINRDIEGIIKAYALMSLTAQCAWRLSIFISSQSDNMSQHDPEDRYHPDYKVGIKPQCEIHSISH